MGACLNGVGYGGMHRNHHIGFNNGFLHGRRGHHGSLDLFGRHRGGHFGGHHGGGMFGGHHGHH